MKYSARFERDYEFYIKNLERFSFCGKNDNEFLDKNGNDIVVSDINGVCAKEAFYEYDSTGKISKTYEPELLLNLYKCKASINLHITLWAHGRGEGTFPRIEWDEYVKKIGLLPWISKAVEKKMWDYRDKHGYKLMRESHA